VEVDSESVTVSSSLWHLRRPYASHLPAYLMPNNCGVLPSRSPRYYVSSRRSHTEPGGETGANNVHVRTRRGVWYASQDLPGVWSVARVEGQAVRRRDAYEYRTRRAATPRRRVGTLTAMSLLWGRRGARRRGRTRRRHPGRDDQHLCSLRAEYIEADVDARQYAARAAARGADTRFARAVRRRVLAAHAVALTLPITVHRRDVTPRAGGWKPPPVRTRAIWLE